MNEQYTPSQKDINKAEAMMTDEQREMSEKRIAELIEWGKELEVIINNIEEDRTKQNKQLKDACGPDTPDIIWKDEYKYRALKEAREKIKEILDEK